MTDDLADDIYEATGMILGTQKAAAMTAFVRAREAAARNEAAAEIERLRAALLEAEMKAEIADIEDVGRLVAIGRREGLKRIVEMFDRHYPYDDIAAEARALLECER